MTIDQTHTVGELLRRQRTAAGLTQEELAGRAGLSVRAISDIERGVKKRPHQDTIRLLAEALGLSAAEHRAFRAARGRRPTVQPGANPFMQPGAGPTEDAARRGGRDEVPPTLVGRAAERALLEQYLAGTGPPVLLLAGEPGFGKSRLLREAAARAAGGGWRVLHGGCQRRSGQEPFAPLLEALDRYLQHRSPAELRTDLHGCAWLVRLLPELAAGPIEPLPGWTLPPEQERRLMDKAVGRLLTNVAGPMGTLLLLDDLQWAGADALSLLAALVHSALTPPLRVLGAYRDSEVQPHDPLAVLLGDLAHAGLAAQHTLTPLTPNEAGQLLDQLVESGPDGAVAARERIVRRAAGVPFFLVSYAQGVQASGDGAAEAIPWDVSQGVRQRVALLPEPAREVLGAAALIGRVVPPALLCAVVDLSPHAVLPALEAASRARLLIEDGHAYRFAHDLIREVAESEVGMARRQALHRRIARALEEQPGAAPVEQLAYHYGQAEELDRALPYLERAADHAWAQHANVAAEGYYRELVAGLDRLARPLDGARAREMRGLVLQTLARYDEALAELNDAVETYQTAGDVESMGRTLAHIGHVHALTGTPGAGIARLQPVRRLLDARAPAAALAAVCAALAELFYFTGQYSDDLAAATQAAEVARGLCDERLQAFAEYQQGMALAWMGQVDDGLRVLEGAIARAETAGDLSTLCEALDPVRMLYTWRGEFGHSTRLDERAARVAEQLGDPAWIANMTGSMTSVFAGQWDQARDAYERSVALSRQAGASMVLMYVLVWRGRLHLWSGDWDAAVQDLEEDRVLVERAGDLWVLRQVQALLAEWEVLTGRPAAARARLLPVLDRFDQEELEVTGLLPTLAWAYLGLDQVTVAGEVADQAARRARVQSHRLALVDALRVQAMVARRQGRWAAAAQALDEGLALARPMPYPYAEARLLEVYGTLYLQQGDCATARVQLEAALAIFRRLGARKDGERVQHTMADLPAS